MVAYFSCFFSASTDKQEQRLGKYDSDFIGLNEQWKQPAESIKLKRSIKSMISTPSKIIDRGKKQPGISIPAARLMRQPGSCFTLWNQDLLQLVLSL